MSYLLPPVYSTPRKTKCSKRSKQFGMSLIEVLISVLVLAIGILGMAGLQMNAKQTNFEALQRSTASALMQNMLERMRANSTALADYASDQTSAPKDCTANSCTASELAAWDRWEWKQLLEGTSESGRGGLVDPTACIIHDAGDVAVTVYWTGLADIRHTSANACAGLAAGDISKIRVLELQVFISE